VSATADWVPPVRPEAGSAGGSGKTGGPSNGTGPKLTYFPNDSKLLKKALRGDNGDKFQRLLVEGDATGYQSASAADMAAVGILRFYTQDPAQIERIIKRSALKRDEHENTDDLQHIIARVLASPGATYDPLHGVRHSASFASSQKQSPGQKKGTSEPPELLSQQFHDVGNADRLIAYKERDMRYCHATEKWLVWDGYRWKDDESERSRKLAHDTVWEFWRQATEDKNNEATEFARSSLNSSRISNMLREAQPHLAITPAELDQHSYLLNFTNGTVDLRTGELQPHRREDFITKLVHFSYDPGAKCTLFLKTVAQLMGGDTDPERAESLVSYLQRAFGYSLTGDTISKAVFFTHGGGDNGKTTILTVFGKLVDEYSAVLDIDTLTSREENNATRADIAGLRGARFVRSSETKEGQRLSESKLKRLTQGMGLIKAKLLYENPITFQESHKLWIDGNHKPVIQGVDDAIWNRLHLVPFTVQIAKDKIDRSMPDKLLAEAEGILAWAVLGAKLWWDEGRGLTKPDEVEAAGSKYREEQDQVAQFVADCCSTSLQVQGRARALYNAYKAWAQEGGERWLSETAFGTRLGKLGHTKEHSMFGTIYHGIGLRAPVAEPSKESR